MSAGSVVVAHPARQHAYETVLAAQENGLLRAFATGVYAGGNTNFARALRNATRVPLVRNALRAVPNRMHAQIDATRVVQFPAFHVASRLARPFPFGVSAEQWADRACGAAIGSWLEELVPPPALVHSFEGAALEIFDAARNVGAVTVLDVPNAHEFAQREGAPPASPARNARVRAERATADWLLAPSDIVERCLVEHGVPRERILRIPYGVDIEHFTPARKRSDGTFRALFVGFISQRKGVPELLTAWRELGFPRAELTLVGGADSAGREILRQFDGCYRWVDQVPRADVRSFYAESDVFVLPSRVEGSALVTYEAMASGLPIVTTSSSGSVARDGIDGFVTDPRDVGALADRLRFLYDHPEERIAMGGSARELVTSEYTWGDYRRRLAAAYQDMLRASAAAAWEGDRR